MKFKSAAVVVLSILTIGCGSQPTAMSSLSTGSQQFHTYADGNGVMRAFDFDYDRAVKLQNARLLKGHRNTLATVPPQCDLRKLHYFSQVGDQGTLGACTGWALANGLREYIENKKQNHFLNLDDPESKYTTSAIDLSPLYLYYKEREAKGATEQDSGATITEGMAVLQNTGVCPEADWPYDVTKFNLKPSTTADNDAGTWKAENAKPLASLQEVKSEIAQLHAVAFGFQVYRSFMSKKVAKTGIMPEPGGLFDKVVGGHAVLAVGYDDTKQVLIVRNSWGPNWGDKGYFYMPYSVATKYTVDFWTAY